AIRRGLAATGRALKRGVTALGRTVGKVVPRNLARLGARAAGYVGRKAKAGIAKIRALYEKGRERLFGKRKPKKPKETPLERLTRFAGIPRQRIAAWISRGLPQLAFSAALQTQRLAYRLSALTAKRNASGMVDVEAKITPSVSVGQGLLLAGEPLRTLIH